jgi:DNA-binding response OmpR family regulator
MKKNPRSKTGAGARALPLRQLTVPHRILVVDEDPFFCHRHAEVLIRHGYAVNATEDSESGWAELQTVPYHLVIAKSEPPALTGMKLVEKLHSARMPLPVILLAHQLPREQAAHQLWHHPVVTLIEPDRPEIILAAVKVVLMAAHAPRAGLVPVGLSCRPPGLGLWL